MSQFNKNLKKIGELAEWTHEVGKKRSKQGKPAELTYTKKKEIDFAIYYPHTKCEELPSQRCSPLECQKPLGEK